MIWLKCHINVKVQKCCKRSWCILSEPCGHCSLLYTPVNACNAQFGICCILLAGRGRGSMRGGLFVWLILTLFYPLYIWLIPGSMQLMVWHQSWFYAIFEAAGCWNVKMDSIAMFSSRIIFYVFCGVCVYICVNILWTITTLNMILNVWYWNMSNYPQEEGIECLYWKKENYPGSIDAIHLDPMDWMWILKLPMTWFNMLEYCCMDRFAFPVYLDSPP